MLTFLFIKVQNNSITYLLLCVDDIIIIGSNSYYITELISQLQARFEMTYLGTLKYFFGLGYIILSRLGWVDPNFSTFQPEIQLSPKKIKIFNSNSTHILN